MTLDPENAMQDLIERKIRSLILAAVPAPTEAGDTMDGIAIFYRGEPGPDIPTRLYPFASIFLDLEQDANSEGYGASTGVRQYRYDGSVSIEVLMKDAVSLDVREGTIPLGDDARAVDVPSYIAAKTLIQKAILAVWSWADEYGMIAADPVISGDGLERTTELIVEGVRNGLASRSAENYSNRSSFTFHVYTTRQLP